jgi:hypothetical protein
VKEERGRPSAAPFPSTRERSVRHGQRKWDNPAALPDDELMLLVRGLLAVDRAVDGYRGKRRPA